jgi:hypothetical protein
MNGKSFLILMAVTTAVAWAFLLGPMVEPSEGAVSLSSRYYQHKQIGFKFRYISGWKAFPPEPKDKLTVVKFRVDRADRGYVAEPNCYVGRLTADGDKSIEDYLKSFWARHVTVNLQEKRFLPTKKLPPGSKQFYLGLAAGGDRAEGLACEYKRREDSIVVIYYCSAREFDKKYKRVFMMSLASFKFTREREKEDEDGGSLEASGDESAIDRRYKEIQKQGVYNCKPEDRNAVINRLRIIRPEYHRYFPPLKKEFVDNAAPIVRVCANERDFQTYSGMPTGVGGYWSPGVEELVVFRKSDWLSMKKLFFDILHHEGFHQYIFYACGGVSPCICFNEGPAEFFGAFKQAGNRMIPTLENRMRKPVIKGAVNSGSFVPLKTILRYSQRQYYSNAGLCYAEGWAITSFLMMGRKYLGGRFKKEWGEIVPTYFKVLQDEVKKEYEKGKGKKEKDDEGSDRESFGFLGSPEKREKILKKAMDEALKETDLEELEEVWKLFVKSKL